MLYASTRGSALVRFHEALMTGRAPDGGLFVPKTYPQVNLSALRPLGFKELAWEILRQFADDIPNDDLADIIDRAFHHSVFGTTVVAPVVSLMPDLHLLKLSDGPTMTSRDIPMQFVGNVMEYALDKSGEELNVLCATLGDTGSAAAYALRGKPGLQLFVLTPKGYLNRFQQQLLYTVKDPNIHNLVVRGTFHEAQTLVEEVNADTAFKKKYRIGSADPTNWAYVAAQVVCYFWGYFRATTGNAERVRFAIPTGNFANGYAAHIARKLGLPMDILLCTNENDLIKEFFHSGNYRVRKEADVKPTTSPFMDVAIALSFEQWIYDYYGGDNDRVKDAFEAVRTTGRHDVGNLNPGSQFGISCGRTSRIDRQQIINQFYRASGTIVGPHTAAAIAVAQRQHTGKTGLIAVVTDQPAMFTDTIREALGGFSPSPPKSYAKLVHLLHRVTEIDPDVDALKEYIAQNA